MKQFHLYRNIAVFSASLLTAFCAVYFYSPVTKTHAATSEVSPEVILNVNSSISLSSSSDEVSMDANINTFVHEPLTLTVTTNSVYGYTLTIEDADDNTNMVHDDSSITDVITSNFTGSKTSSTMDKNTWGWSVDSGANYYNIPVLGLPTLVARTDSIVPGGTASTVVDFGVNVGLLTSGTYSDVVVFTAYTNGTGGATEDGMGVAAKGAKVDGLMQNYNCSTLASGNTVTLKDTRDNNTYTVTKLADGKCWMTENLRIANRTLTSDDSDLTNTMVLGKSMSLPELQRILSKRTKVIQQIYSSFPRNESGAVVLTNPEDIAKFAKMQKEFAAEGNYISYANGGYYDTTNIYGGTDNMSEFTQNSTSNFDVQTSICPKGWKLPTDAEFNTLIGKYNGVNALTSAPVNLKITSDLSYAPVDESTFQETLQFKIVLTEDGKESHYATSTVHVDNIMPGADIPGLDTTVINLQAFHIDPQKAETEDYMGFAKVRCIAR